jgi:NitT/TauT family transport system permease protein
MTKRVNGAAGSVGSWIISVWLTRLILCAGVIALWEYLAAVGAIDAFFWGRPSGIAHYLFKWGQGTLLNDLLVTLAEAFMGLVIGAVAGVVAGIALGLSPFWRTVMQPFIDLGNSTPRIALAPLFLLWLGLGMASKVGVVVSIVFFIMIINVQEGVLSINRDYIRLLRILGGGRRERIRYVVLPASVAWIKVGLRLSIPYSIAGAVIGEFVAASQGLGYRLVQEAGDLNAAGVLGVVFVLAMLGTMLSAISNSMLADGRAHRSRMRRQAKLTARREALNEERVT